MRGPESIQEYLRSYPRLCAAIIALSNRYATPAAAAYLVRDVHERPHHDWSWLVQDDPLWSRRVVTSALAYRHNLDGYPRALAQVRETNAQRAQLSQPPEDHRAPSQSNLSLVITTEGFINIAQACEFRLRHLDPSTTDTIWGIDVLLANGRNHLIANNDPGFDQLIDALEDQGYTISVAEKPGGSRR